MTSLFLSVFLFYLKKEENSVSQETKFLFYVCMEPFFY